MSPQGISYVPWNNAMPTDASLDDSSKEKVRAKRNSFQQKMKVNMPVEMRPGNEIGVIIYRST